MRPDEFASSQRYCVQVRARTKDRSQHWHLLNCQRVPVQPLSRDSAGWYRAARSHRGAHRSSGPGSPGRGGSLRACRTGHPTPDELGLRLVGLGEGKATTEEAPEKVCAGLYPAAAGRRGWETGLPGSRRPGPSCHPRPGDAEGEPHFLLPISLSSGHWGLPASCPVQIPLFSHRFLFSLLNLNRLLFGRYDRI